MAKSCRIISQSGWQALSCENHDQPRSVTRFCDNSDAHRVTGTKLLSIMQTSLPGTLYVYQGEELGMRNVPKSWNPTEYKDIKSIKYWKNICAKFPQGSAEMKKANHLLRLKARDNARTPMQWDYTANGGFCPKGVQPWMRVNDDYPDVNAALQVSAGRANDRSMLVSPYRFWQRSIETRKNNADLLIYGKLDIINNTHPNAFAYKRSTEFKSSITVLNFSKDKVDLTFPADKRVQRWILGSYDSLSMEKPKGRVIWLLPWEGLLGLMENDPHRDDSRWTKLL
ncbi:hypothetical protein HG530_011801 [Fusarium avenaceum]|nr:hypothetical protein HG530_011801 [Fusarium avenaceum]